MIVVRLVKRWPRIDRLFEGDKNPIVIDGKYDEKELARLGLRHGDVETAIRRQGASSIDEVEHAIDLSRWGDRGAAQRGGRERDAAATSNGSSRSSTSSSPRRDAEHVVRAVPAAAADVVRDHPRAHARGRGGRASTPSGSWTISPRRRRPSRTRSRAGRSRPRSRCAPRRSASVTSSPATRSAIPAVLAKMAATVDVLSDGRLELGHRLGLGRATSSRRYGIGAGPPAARAARMRETIEILDLMFAGEPFDHAGERFSCAGAIGRPRAGPAAAAAAAHRWRGTAAHDADRARRTPTGGTARRTRSIGSPSCARSRATRGSRCSTRSASRVRRADRDDVVAVGERRFGSWGGLVAGTADRGRRRARGRGRGRSRGLRAPAHRLRPPRDDRALHDRRRPSCRADPPDRSADFGAVRPPIALADAKIVRVAQRVVGKPRSGPRVGRVAPAGRDDLAAGVEVHALGAVHVRVAEQALLPARRTSSTPSAPGSARSRRPCPRRPRAGTGAPRRRRA